LALQTPKFYLAGSKKSRKSGFLRSIDRKNPHLEQALTTLMGVIMRGSAENRMFNAVNQYNRHKISEYPQ
jgi:hypothetical protein